MQALVSCYNKIMITLYNTLSRQEEAFKPVHPPRVTFYSCGPTVYDYPHIGNWYAFIRWDVLVRMLRASNYTVDWVMNITDVGHLVSDADEGEDKLEKGARREGKTAWDVADYYADYFFTALQRLNFTTITHTPKATDYIQEQIALVRQLEEKGCTYRIDDGVYFDTAKFADYGTMARLDTNALMAGARVEFNKQKRQATDFALWKFSPKNEKRDMEWDSPWGKGFPGWHIECSAMSMQLLGRTLDIHAGGIDHIPVHHTNEIAQSEAATGQQFANYWLHSNFIKVDGKKMSKSLGNLITLEDIEQAGISLHAFRLLVLESHYRNEAQFTWDVLRAAANRYQNWVAIADLRWQPQANTTKQSFASAPLLDALQQDLNTPLLLQRIDAQFAETEAKGITAANVTDFTNYLQYIEALTGLTLCYDDINDDQKTLLSRRATARKAKDWVLSDQLREELAKTSIQINDSQQGQRWTRLI